jgi:hypothetical protein
MMDNGGLMNEKQSPATASVALGQASIRCVDPAEVGPVWPLVADLIASALDRGGGLTDFAMVARAVLDGRWLLWLAQDRPPTDTTPASYTFAVAVTSLATANGKKFCTVVACGGRDLDLWYDLIERIEDFARDEGCASVVIQGRRGWARVLTGYEPIATIMERRL